MKPTRPCRSGAFTLLELLVVIAIVGVLAALLLPAMSVARDRVRATACAANLAQLLRADSLYTADNSGSLVNNYPLLAPRQPNPDNWFLGFAGYPHDPVYGPTPQYACTNVDLARSSKLFAYHKSVEISRCPADTRRVGGLPVVRNFSINSWMNGSAIGDPSGKTATALDNPSGDGGLSFRFFRNECQFGAASLLFVLIDEATETINDSMFVVDMSVTAELADKPTSRHAGAYTISFADGHTEIFRRYGLGASRLKAQPLSSVDPDWYRLSHRATSPNN